MNTAIETWVDGQVGNCVPLSDRALQYGDGVFRTLLVWDGVVQRLASQLDKLLADAQQIGLKPPPRARLEQELSTIAGRRQRAVIKLVLSAGDSARGYLRGDTPCRRMLSASPLPPWPAAYWSDGIRIASLAYRLSEQPALAGVKHLNRLDQVLARAQLPEGCSEGLLGDQRGLLSSGIMSNVFWWQDGGWHTPPLDRAGVAGSTRADIIRCLDSLDMPVRITQQSLEHCQAQCTALFVCNSVVGIWPVRQWHERVFEPPAGGGHPSLRGLSRLIRAFAHPFKGFHDQVD